MNYIDKKINFEELYAPQFLKQDISLLEEIAPKNRVLARKHRFKNLAHEVLWQLLEVTTIEIIKSNRANGSSDLTVAVEQLEDKRTELADKEAELEDKKTELDDQEQQLELEKELLEAEKELVKKEKVAAKKKK